MVERIEQSSKRKFEHQAQLIDKALELRRAKDRHETTDPRAAALLAYFDEECKLSFVLELDELSNILSPAAGTR